MDIGSDTIQIPEGYTAVIREIILKPNEALYTVDSFGKAYAPMLLTFFINNGGVANNVQMRLVPVESTNRYELFFIVPQSAILKVQVEMDLQSFGYGDGEGINIDYEIRANLLLSDDRPSNLQTSTKNINAPSNMGF